MDNFSNRLHHEVVSCRMRPFGDGARGFPRMIRDVSKALGKKVKLEITGKDTDVDRDMLDKLEAPLTHLLRNAVDHGIESPAERSAAGKSETGTIRLIARHWAGMLYITVSDDGKGIYIEHLREKVVKRNLVTEAMAKTLSDVELIEFMFLPGFSTASSVTEISGRGVGLDVVQNMVQEVQGVVRSETRPGNGTSFHLQLPITLSVMRALLVQIGDEPYALPMVRIDRILSVPREEIQVLENRQYITFDNNNIGLVSARQVLGLGEVGLDAETLPIAVIGDRLNQFGIVVDRFIGEKELVINPLDPRLGKVADINATALLEDGSPVLLIDVEDMVRSIDNLLNGGWLQRVGMGTEKTAEQKKKRILVVDDSLTVREVERKLLETNGYEVEIAVDGADGWNAVRIGSFDMVISDVDMPRMNGIELVTHIRQNARLKNLPVMIVSYKDREEDRKRGLDAGADYYLTKSSFHDNTLLDAVANLIGKAKA
jgi:two-component system, chemotaxis family, sensor histidine kinase and response regulator WspE